MTAPILTDVVGVPATITRRDQLTGTMTFDPPFLGGVVGGAVGVVPIRWSAAHSRWENTNTTGQLQTPAARDDVEGVAAPEGVVIFDLHWVDEGNVRRSAHLEYVPLANAAGVLDLTETQNPKRFMPTAGLLEAYEAVKNAPETIEITQGLIETLQDDADGFATLTAMVQPALDEVAQATADALAVTGIVPAYVSETTADPPVAPDGTRGARRNTDGSFQRLMRVAGAWVTAGAALLTLGSLPTIDVRTRDIRPTNTAAYNSAQFQALVDAAPNGSTIVIPPLLYQMSTMGYISNKKDLVIEGQGATFAYPSGIFGSIMVHGGSMNRTLTGPAWAEQLLNQDYETTTPCSGVVIKGLTVQSTDGARRGTQMLFYFADDSGLDGVTIRNSNGNGVEFRQSVRPIGRKFVVDDFANYGMFVYQCYKADLSFVIKNGGRGWELKQRHKFYGTLDHHIHDFTLEDLTGFAGEAWFTAGVSYQDAVGNNYSSAIIAARNFAGHEITRGVTIEHGTLRVTDAAGPNVKAPSMQVGAFCDGFTIQDIDVFCNGRLGTSSLIYSGSVGYSSTYSGAVYGRGHVWENIRVDGANYLGVPMVSYAVSTALRRLRLRNSTARILFTQADAQYLPNPTIERVELTGTDAIYNAVLGVLGEQGIRIQAETTTFVTGANRITATPVNDTTNASYSLLNLFSMKGSILEGGEGDDFTAAVNPAATNHTVTYGAYLLHTAGRYGGARFHLGAPVSVIGVQHSPTGGNARAFTLLPVTLDLLNTPSSSKVALRTDAEIIMPGGKAGHIFAGAWTTTLLDNSDGGTTGLGLANIGQNGRRIVPVTGVPTSGSWSAGDIGIKTNTSLGNILGYACYSSGTFGGTAPNFGTFGQVGFRTISVTPTFSAQFVGEILNDQVAQIWYRSVTAGNGAADWHRASYRLPVSFTLTPPSIAPGTTWESGNLALSASVLNDHVLVGPPGGMTGLMATAYVASSGQARVQIYNGSGAAITPASATYKLTLIKN